MLIQVIWWSSCSYIGSLENLFKQEIAVEEIITIRLLEQHSYEQREDSLRPQSDDHEN